MSFLKKWKLFFVVSIVIFFTACAGSSGGGGDHGDYDGSGTSGGDGGAKQTVVNKNELKDAEKEAIGLTEENHKLRREIFEAKHQLGIPVEQQSGDE
ncbi:MAG: hypothetical protein GX116_09015 [Fibrobacter sp.]|jgi:hypothetical protein|nr:hypothetical protein [Fibrobacter sp.]